MGVGEVTLAMLESAVAIADVRGYNEAGVAGFSGGASKVLGDSGKLVGGLGLSCLLVSWLFWDLDLVCSLIRCWWRLQCSYA